ncbi:MAG: protein adenylyltransferase SelO family protein, partial [Flavobacteriales bacterium]
MKLNYSKLPTDFYSEVSPAKFEKAQLVFWNEGFASEFKNGFSSNDFLSMVRGENSWLKDTLAMAYAGHQFGHFNILGDGRAALVDEWKNEEGKLFDVHLKGSGETIYSRRGDGRATLKAMLREAIMSEAIHALGIRTTRTLAVVDTGDFIHRNGMEKGGMLAR